MGSYGEYDKKELKKLQNVLIEMLKDVNYICDKYNIKYFALDGTGIGAMRHKGFIPWDDDIDLRFIEDDIPKFIECVEKEMPDKYFFIGEDNGVYPIAFVKMCKKNTLYVDEIAKELNYKEMGIFIDLLPMVYVPDDKKTREKNLIKSWYWYKLGIMAAVKNPLPNLKGVKGRILTFAFAVTHFILKIFRVKYTKIFKKGYNIAAAKEKTHTVSSLNTVKKLTCIYDLDDIYPIGKMPFEDTYVYTPNNIDKMLRIYFGNYMELPPKDKRHNHYPCELKFDVKNKK